MNPYGDNEVSSSNPFGDDAVSENPYGDQPVEAALQPQAKAQDDSEPFLNLPANAMMGGITPGTFTYGGKLGRVMKESAGPAQAQFIAGLKYDLEVEKAIKADMTPTQQIVDNFTSGTTGDMYKVALFGSMWPMMDKILPKNNTRQEKLKSMQETEGMKEARSVAQLAQQDMQEVLKDTGLTGDVLASTSQTLVNQIPAATLAVITKKPQVMVGNAALQTYGGSIGGSLAQNEPLEKYEDVRKVAQGQALTEALFETVGAKYLVDNIGKEGLARLLGKYVVLENATEIPTTIVQDAIEWAKLHPEKPLSQWAAETGHDVLVTALSTPLSAGATGGAAHLTVKTHETVANKLNEIKEERKLQQLNKAEQEVFNELATGVTEDQILGTVLQKYRTQEIDPQTAHIQAAQAAGALAEVPDTPFGTDVGKKIYSLFDENTEGDLPDSGVTPAVEARRERYAEEEWTGRDVPFEARQIMYQTNPEAVGLRLGQLPDLPDGSTTVIAGDLLSKEVLYPGAITDMIGKSVDQLRKTVGLNDPVLVTLEMLGGGKSGAYTTLTLPDGRTAHVINPRDLPSFKAEYKGGNWSAITDFAHTLTHEFGHALKMEKFQQGILSKLPQSPEGQLYAAGVREAIAKGTISDQEVAALKGVAPIEGALVERWKALRDGALAGTISGRDFATAWLGPRKFSRSFYRTKGTRDIWAYLQERSGRGIDQMTAKDVIKAVVGDGKRNQDYFLNFDEFMAEQFSRAAQSKGMLEKTELGRWFKDVLDALKKFFKSAQDQKFIKPDVSFEQWLDEITAAAKAVKRPRKWGQVKLNAELQQKQREQAAAMEAQLQSLRVNGENEVDPDYNEDPEEPINEESAAAEDEITKDSVEQYLDSAVQMGIVKETSKEYKEIQRLISKDQLQLASDKLWDLIAKGDDKIHFDKEYSTKLIEDLPKKEILKKETVTALMQQQKIRRQDKEAAAEYLALVEGGMVSREELAQYILAKNVPLEMTQTLEWADMGLSRIFDYGFASTAKSHVWTGPQHLSFDNHFKRGNYVAHSRIIEQPTANYLVEMQSDYFARQSAKSLSKKAEKSFTETLTARTVVRDQYKRVEELKAAVPDENGMRKTAFGLLNEAEYAKQLAAQEASLARAEQFSIERAELHNEVVERKKGKRTPEELAVNAAVGTNYWWQRIVREEFANAAKGGKAHLYLASPRAIATIEGWTEDDTRNLFGVDQTDQKPLKFDSPEYQQLFDFYQKEVWPWFQKTYQAEVVEEQGVLWLKAKVGPEAKKVFAWDKEDSRPTYPQIESEMIAGVENLEDSQEVERAIEAWGGLKEESPWFKKWWGDGRPVDAVSGKPLKVFHRPGHTLEYYDVPLNRIEKIFFFTSDPMSASRSVVSPFMQKGEGPSGAPVSSYYVRMVKPLQIPYEGEEWSPEKYETFVNTAKANGYDGLIISNNKTTSEETIYVAFNAEQIKDAFTEQTAFEASDRFMYDKSKDSMKSSVEEFGESLSTFDPKTPFRGATNLWHRLMDSLVQLQQRAAKPLSNGQLDMALNAFLNATMQGQAFKNNLQQPAETLVKEMREQSGETIDKMYRFLELEAKEGKNWFDLQGWNANPDTQQAQRVWGTLEDGSEVVTAAAGATVGHWRYGVDSTKTKTLIQEKLREVGLSTETEHGEDVLHLILATKNTMLEQFTQLQHVLEKKIAQKFSAAPQMAALELQTLYQTMQKIRLTPFLPQGRYGDNLVIVQQEVKDRQKGQRKWETVRVEHYESKAAMQTALAKWHTYQARNKNVKVTSKIIDKREGIPLNLPRNLLYSFEQTNLFTKEQLETMGELMLPAGHEKIEARYARVNDMRPGGEKDLVKNYANFIHSNANFIWKLDFRSKFTKVINAQNAAVARAQQVPTPEGRALADELIRNRDLMYRIKEYLLYPPNELQALRTGVALAYLAYNVKTAVMNLSTVVNSYAAITTEYGEIQGHKFFLKGLGKAAKLYSMRKQENKQVNAEGLSQEDMVTAWAYNRAVMDGVLDQSYSYFLAAAGNGSRALADVRKSWFGRSVTGALDLGMYPFRMIEHSNRLTTFLMFFEAERAGRGVGIAEAYDAAVKRVNLLQNSYETANRSELFRGKKALFTMFYSYTQFMIWNMTGGYSKALHGDLESRQAGKVKHLVGAQAYTIKMWFIYLMLGGVMGLPFMQDILSLVQAMYRKLFGGNVQLEMRKTVKELGYEPEVVMHGLLHNVAGMDLSGSFSLGRVIPGVDMVNRDMKSMEEWAGNLGVRGAGPFGGFTADLYNFLNASNEWLHGNKRGAQVTAELPGAMGAVSKALDAWNMQALNPTYGVMDKAGARLVEDPPGSGKFRDLTEWELVGMALNGNPTVLSTNREIAYFQTGEQIYWRTKRQSLLDNRWEAIRTNDQKMRATADEQINDFNKGLPEGYGALRITGKTKMDSLKAHKRNIRDREIISRNRQTRAINEDVEAAFEPATE